MGGEDPVPDRSHPDPRRAKDVFGRAVELPDAQRERYLVDACRGEPAVEERVRELLVAHEHSTTVLPRGLLARARANEYAGGMDAERSGRRWGAAAAIVAVGAAAIVWTWLGEAEGQRTSITTAVVDVLTLSGLLVWALALAGFARSTRVAIGVAAVLVPALAAVLVELRGVTGDFVPVLGWRFAPDAGPELGALEPVEPAPAAAAPALAHAPFPQFLGSGRDGVIRGVRLARDWESAPPRELWRRPIGAGWSGFAVDRGVAVTHEQRGEHEVVAAYDLATGAPLWEHADEARYGSTIAGIGPRATPSIDGERVVALGATGLLTCLDRTSGALRWQRDVVAENGARIPQWGLAASPLVARGLVVVAVGGGDGRALVAYDAQSGERAWSGGTDGAGYASPALVRLAGVEQVLVLGARALTGFAPASGEVLWTEPWQWHHPNVAQPVLVSDERLVVSTGYGVGAAAFDVARAGEGALEAQRAWSSIALKAKFANFVHHAGFLYGLDDGAFACVDASTGKRVWKRGRYGHGQLLLVGDVALVLTEDGEIVLVEATPAEHRELARAPALAGKTWNSPAFAAPYLVVRNDAEAACFELSLQR